jgi:hypothetical protein
LGNQEPNKHTQGRRRRLHPLIPAIAPEIQDEMLQIRGIEFVCLIAHIQEQAMQAVVVVAKCAFGDAALFAHPFTE